MTRSSLGWFCHARAARPPRITSASIGSAPPARALRTTRRDDRQCCILGPLSPLCHSEAQAWYEVMAVHVPCQLSAHPRPGRAFEPPSRRVFDRLIGVAADATLPIGTLRRSKPRSKRWRATYAAETARPPMCGSIVHAARAHPLRRAQCAGADLTTREPPDHVAQTIVDMFLPSRQESGSSTPSRRQVLTSACRPEPPRAGELHRVS